MTRATLLFHHTHTPDSNAFEAAVRDLHIRSHVTDYVAIARALPPAFDAVFVKTDHWRTDPAYFDRLERQLEDQAFERFERCVQFTVDDTTAVVVNGVETAVDTRRCHVTVVGLPLADEATYECLGVDELVALGRRASWIAPAHIWMPRHRYTRSLLDRLVSKATDAGVDVALGYPTGYPPIYNRLTRNDLPWVSDVTAVAESLAVPLVPELDTHAALPPGLAGCGVLRGGIEAGDVGEGLLAELLSADLFSPPGVRGGITVGQFLANYAPFLPGPTPEIDYEAMFERTLPDADRLAGVSLAESVVEL